MAKLIGPLMSMGARGQIGKGLVTATWRGVKYARQYVVPANPQTTAQQENRTRFALLREMWKLAPAQVIAPWDAFAQGRPFTGMNKFVGENNRLLVGQILMDNAIMSPGARGGLPPVGIVAAPGAATGEVDVTFTVPTQLPSGWTITACHAAAIPQQNPVGLFDGPFVAGSDMAAPYEVTLTGFDSAEDVVAYGWIEYENANGLAAYSVSLSDSTTAGV